MKFLTNWILPVLMVALLCFSGLSHSRQPKLKIPLSLVKKWARNFGAKIFNNTKRATGISNLSKDYKVGVVVEPVRGKRLVQKLAKQMENMLQKKVKAVKNLADAAENAFLNYKFDASSEPYDYFNAKKIVPDTVVKRLPDGPSSYRSIHVYKQKGFHGISVNSSLSTVHVPTNVYDQSPEVVKGIAWSSLLDKQFRENAKNDSSLMWQYFGSSTGFFRIYPGMIWPRNNKDGNVDMFDCRVRGWYIQAATFPKDMVILLDSSGSMHGLRAAIARSTVGKILETLSDNDFFNIIYFNKKPSYLADCLNRTLIQANTDNRKRLREALVSQKARDVANFELALIEAFELFEHTKNKSKGTGCYTNKVIMLVTDGAPETYEWVFQKYNWGPNNSVDVPVFTYLIGREVSDSRQVNWMACVNKGHHTHISTLADVQENVQKYIKVLSRPTLRPEDKNVAWSPVYLDFIQSLEDQSQLDTLAVDQRLQLMTSVAQPVFDKRNDTSGEGKLLGVVGTDVLISELTKLTPNYLLGVNGYSFVVTNNGYLLFHPELRPGKWNNQKPNYNSVSLTEVEAAKKAEKLKIAMTNREIGSMLITSKLHYDDMKRVTVRNTSFFYAPIGRSNIPFSLGIALPRGYGEAFINAGISDIANFDLKHFEGAGVEVAPWPYCEDMEKKKENERCVDVLVRNLDMVKAGNRTYKSKCATDMMKNLLFDASTTSRIHQHWTGNRNIESCSYLKNAWCSVDYLQRLGIELVFIGTRTGLTRYMKTTANLTDPDFISKNTNTIDDTYYKRAADIGRNNIVFSVPALTGLNESYDVSKVVVTASMPFHLQMGNDSSVSTVAAVLGYQMKYRNFQDTFLGVVERCPRDQSGSRSERCGKMTCASDDLECYLIDNNGFVLYAKNENFTGMFFDDVTNYDIFRHMVKKKIFKGVNVTDNQGLCVKESMDLTNSPAAGLTTPFKWMFSLVMWTLREFAFLIAEWGLLTWFSEYHAVAAVGEEDDPSLYAPEYLDMAGDGFSESEWIQWYQVINRHPNTFNKCLRRKLKDYFVTSKEQKSCSRNATLYQANYDVLPKSTSIPNCHYCVSDTLECSPKGFTCIRFCDVKGPCEKSYVVERVAHTNLLLVVVDAKCYCDPVDRVSVRPEIQYDENYTLCHKLKESRHRPSQDQPCPSMQVEKSKVKCGGTAARYSGLFVSMQVLVLMFSGMLSS